MLINLIMSKTSIVFTPPNFGNFLKLSFELTLASLSISGFKIC